MVQSACFYLFLNKFESISKMEGKEKKEFLFFLPFLKVCDQLQTSGISKRFDAQKRDRAQIVDYLT